MKDTLRVLLIEDSASDAKLVLAELQGMARTIEAERVDTEKGMRAALARQTWDVVLSDWSMPKFSAPAALATLRETHHDLPFIIVSGTIGEETAVEAMRAGAHDYVLKDKLVRLAPAVERELREHEERVARRSAENALKESAARLRKLSESGIIGIMIAELRGRVLSANDTFLRLVGYSHEELLHGAIRWDDLTPPEHREARLLSVKELRTTGVSRPIETESFRRDGSRVPILTGAATLDESRYIAFVLDQSDRRRAEKESMRLALEARKEQEGRVLAEEHLRESEKQLRQAQKMEAVGRLAGGVAHDFNNVLSVIISQSELILEDLKQNDLLRQDIEEILKAALRAAGLTHQLLMFSRQQVVEPKVLDLGEVLAGLEKMLQRILGEDVELVVVTPSSVGRVKVDPSHIEQVILNLVVNARDAMPTGGKLTIETQNVLLDERYALSHLPTRTGAHVMMAVSDTGVGMDAETQARIFEPFFTTKEVGKGTGLGLSTVFGIVKQSGGNVWVYSEKGRGTTFKIYLPRVDAEVDVVRLQSMPATLRGKETILVVEDEDQVRAIVLSILRRQGYRLIPAQNAGEALLLCERHPETIDLLLTDVVMPQMSGPELAKRLMKARPGMKVLCMSGYTDDSIVRHGVLESGVAFVQKPITPASLAQKVREVLDEGSASLPPPGNRP